MQMAQQQQPQTGVIQLNAITVGEKVEGSALCYCLTFMFMCLIFPVFFIFCTWWHKIVYPKYQVTPDFYRAVSQFIKSNNNCTTVKLAVCDNAFNS